MNPFVPRSYANNIDTTRLEDLPPHSEGECFGQLSSESGPGEYLAACPGVRGTNGDIGVLGPIASFRSNAVVLDSPSHEDNRRQRTRSILHASVDKR